MITLSHMITDEWLKENKACPDAIDLFCKEWPEGGEVTHANLLRAAAIGLDMEWFAKRVLPEEVYADYEGKCAALYADYETSCALLIPILLNHFAALPAKQRRQEETK